MNRIHYASLLLLLVIGTLLKNVHAVNPLVAPVNNSFENFQVYLDGDVASLYWSMKSNSGLNSVRIEKSKNGKHFVQLTIIDVVRNTSDLTEYQEIDTKPWKGTTYYRLSAIGLDDSCYYSTICTVKFNKRSSIFKDKSPRANYAVPLKGIAGNDTYEEMLVVVRDIHGVELFSKVTVTGKYGRIITVIDLHEKLAPGIYKVTGSSDGILDARKIRVESVIAVKSQ